MNELVEAMLADNIIRPDSAPLFDRLFNFVDEGTPMPKEEFAKWTEIGLLKQKGKGKWVLSVESELTDAQGIALEFVMALMQYDGLIKKTTDGRYKNAV